MRYKLQKRVFCLQVLLLIPLAIMPFSNAVQWSVFDFIIMAVLLFFLSLGFDLVRFYAASKRQRWLLFALVVLLFLVVWVEFAVGIFN